MAEVNIPITSEGVLSLKQSCQTIIDAYKKYSGSILVDDENGVYPMILEQVKSLNIDVVSGCDSIESLQKLTLDDIERPANAFGELESYREVENISGNVPITQSLYDGAQTEVKDLFDGMKHRESAILEENQGSNFEELTSLDQTDKNKNKNYSQSLPDSRAERVNAANAVDDSFREAVFGGAGVAAGQAVANFKNKSKGKYRNTIIEECIPCDLRLPGLDDLGIDADLLGILEDMLERYKQLAEQLKRLLNNTEVAEDICSLLNFLNFQCLPDLYSIIALLGALMRKYADIIPNLDGAFLQFIGPFFSPLLNGINSILDRYIQLIMRPINCVLDALDTQLAKLDVQRALDENQQRDISFHRRRERALEQRIRELKDRRAFLTGLKNDPDNPVDGGSVPPQRVSAGGNSLDLTDKINELNPLVVTVDEELAQIDQDIARLQGNYDSEYGPGGKNNVNDLLEKSRVPTRNVIGNTRGSLRDVRSGLNSGLFELRSQILQGRDMIEGTFRVLKEELQRLIQGRAATSGDMIEGARNIQRVARLIGFVKTLIRLANTGKLCENSNNDPSIALGSFLTASKGSQQNGNYYNVYVGDNDNGDQSLLIAPSDAVLELTDPNTDQVTQIDNLDEINKLNSDGIPKNIGNITDKKVDATVPGLGGDVNVAIVQFDLCKNSNLSTQANIDEIQQWATNAGFNV